MRFEKLLDRHPDDWELRLIYADWLEEQGYFLWAAGQRWQAQQKKCCVVNCLWQHYSDPSCSGTEGFYRNAWLPGPIFAALKGHSGNFAVSRGYTNRQAAEQALALALLELNLLILPQGVSYRAEPSAVD